MFQKPPENISIFRIALNYILRIICILLAKLFVLKIKKVNVILTEDDLSDKKHENLFEIHVSDIQMEMTYSSNEKFVLSGSIKTVRARFNPTSKVPNDKLEVFCNTIKYVLKFPGNHDMTNAIFNSSMKADVEEVNGNFYDLGLIQMIQFFIKSNLIKQLRRCVYYQLDKNEHLAKFENSLIGSDVIKIVALLDAEIHQD